jgi:hypothetical protein
MPFLSPSLRIPERFFVFATHPPFHDYWHVPSSLYHIYLFHSDKIMCIYFHIAAVYLSVSEEAEREMFILYTHLFTFGIRIACFKDDKYVVTSWWFL